MKTHPLLSILMLTVGLAACGGGDDGPAPPPSAPPPPPPVASNEVPPGAYASTAAYSQYAGGLAPAESSEPLDVDKVVPPTSETEEPIDVT